MTLIDLTGDSDNEAVSQHADTSLSSESDIEIVAISPTKTKSTFRRLDRPTPLSKAQTSDDSDIELVEVSPLINISNSPRTRKLRNFAMESKPRSRSTENQFVVGSSKTLVEDERLALELQAKEREEYRKLYSGVLNRKEGIVFRTVVNADGTLEDGSPAHPDDIDRFEPWKALCVGLRIKRFHWIVNYELEKHFEEAKESLKGTMDTSKELLLFHGTQERNIDSILNNGFRIGGIGGHAVTNGTALGYGIYLATQPVTSLGYAAGANRIFACRVCPGQITKDQAYSNQRPPSADVQDESYHTFANGSGVYVVWVNEPDTWLQMIEFDQPQYNYNAWLLGGVPQVPVAPALLANIPRLLAPVPAVPAAPAARARRSTRVPRKAATRGKGKTKQ